MPTNRNPEKRLCKILNVIVMRNPAESNYSNNFRIDSLSPRRIPLESKAIISCYILS